MINKLKSFFSSKTLQFYVLLGAFTSLVTAIVLALLSTHFIIVRWGIFLVLPSLVLNHVGYIFYLLNRRAKNAKLGNGNYLQSKLSFVFLSVLFLTNVCVLVLVLKLIKDSM